METRYLLAFMVCFAAALAWFLGATWTRPASATTTTLPTVASPPPYAYTPPELAASSGNVGWGGSVANLFFWNRRQDWADPYVPPLRDNPYMVQPALSQGFVLQEVGPGGGSVPVGLGRMEGGAFSQVGILTPERGSGGGDGAVLQLMGRPNYARRDNWNYYTVANQSNMVKLPISRGSQRGMDEFGMNMLSTGDSVFVEGINGAYTVTIYESRQYALVG